MSFNTLRAVANRLTVTSSELLPGQIGFLASSLSTCKAVLSNPSPSNEENVTIHKLKTRVSSLLQDRTPEGRLCGIVIAKALIENGGQTILSGSASWARALISCLNKSDSVETKRLGVITITRLFLLTVNNQTLVREITTPTLSAFITTSLSVIKPSSSTIDGKLRRSLSPLLDVVLRSWYRVLQAFPGTCRPHISSIKTICLSIISDFEGSSNTCQCAIDVLSILHHCSPKANGSKDWLQLFQEAIEAVHDAADLTFRAINEDWTPLMVHVSKVTKKQRSAATPSSTAVDSLGMGPWSGVTQGCGRIIQQLKLVQALLLHPHGSQVSMPVGAVLDLTGRLNAVTLPTSRFAVQANNEITKEERDELWLSITLVHAATIELFKSMIETYEMIFAPTCRSIIIQIWDVFEAEQQSMTLRAATYSFFNYLLTTNMYTLRKAEYPSWSRLIQVCCNDLSIDDESSTFATTLQHATLSQTSRASASQHIDRVAVLSILRNAICQFLPTLLRCGELRKLPNYKSLRAQLDQAAIMMDHEEAILASVLNPFRGKHSSSLLPFLARITQRKNSQGRLFDLASEALLRPRFPIVQDFAEGGLTNGHPKTEQNIQDEEMADLEERIDAGEQIEEGPVIDDNEVALSTAPDIHIQSTGPLKRDFTTLLEQSADAQLAQSNGSSTSHLSDHDPHEQQFEVSTDHSVQPLVKKIRSSPGVERPVGEVPRTEQQIGVEQKLGQGLVLSTPASLSLEQTVGAISQSNPTTEIKGKERAGYESDSDDSVIPAIDATLAGFTDDEDDEDEEAYS